MSEKLHGELHEYSTLSGKLSAYPFYGQISGKLSGGSLRISGKVSPAASVNWEEYSGDYDITPKARTEQVLETKDKVLTDNIRIKEVPYYETHNQYGTTLYIAGEID